MPFLRFILKFKKVEKKMRSSLFDLNFKRAKLTHQS